MSQVWKRCRLSMYMEFYPTKQHPSQEIDYPSTKLSLVPVCMNPPHTKGIKPFNRADESCLFFSFIELTSYCMCVFCGRLILLNVLFVRFFHIVLCGCGSLFSLMHSVLLYALELLTVWATMRIAALNICIFEHIFCVYVCVCEHMYAFLFYIYVQLLIYFQLLIILANKIFYTVRSLFEIKFFWILLKILQSRFLHSDQFPKNHFISILCQELTKYFAYEVLTDSLLNLMTSFF